MCEGIKVLGDRLILEQQDSGLRVCVYITQRNSQNPRIITTAIWEPCVPRTVLHTHHYPLISPVLRSLCSFCTSCISYMSAPAGLGLMQHLHYHGLFYVAPMGFAELHL